MQKLIRIAKLLSTILLAAVVLFIVFFVYEHFFNNNFFTVEKGVLYRSAQPTAENIAQYKAKYGIKTIISLKKKQPTQSWWINETQESAKLGITHYDVALSSTMEAPMFRMIRLIKLFRTADKPILVHCEGGSDRTGLAVALYFFSVRHMPADEAHDKGLSIIYGHFPYFGAKTAVMSTSFRKYVDFVTKKK